MTADSTQSDDAALRAIRSRADALDQSGEWPDNDLQELARAGVMRRAIHPRHGGAGLSALEQHLGYEAIATASVSVALIISQRDSAVELIEAGASPVGMALLPRLARDQLFVTVGIAQLTTSRQGGIPALRASRESGGYRLEGTIPWATSAAKADWIVAGASTADGRQLLFLLPAGATGLTIDPPMPLVALRSSWTTSVHCRGVRIDDELILQGPSENVLARRNSLPLRQAFLATGLCRGTLDLIRDHNSPAAAQAWERFDDQLAQIRRRVIDLSQPGGEADATAAAPLLRGECNDLALRAAHAAVALYKGSALLAGHPANRLAREAMFLLVWSCPNPVIDCTIDLLSGRGG